MKHLTVLKYRFSKQLYRALVALVLLGVVVSTMQVTVFAAQLPHRSISMSSSTAGQTSVRYTLKFDLPSSYVLGSVLVEICSNSPLADVPCVAPTGFNATGVAIASQTGVTNFSIGAGSTANTIILSRTPAIAPAVPVIIELTGITNPSTVGTFYGKLKTFSTNNATGARIDEGGMAMVTTQNFAITTEVPPYIIFCVAIEIPGYSCSGAIGDSVDLGEFSTTSPKTSTSQMLMATNAGLGFYVYVTGTTLTSGNNIIPGLEVPTSSQPGQSQFGLNLADNSSPNVGIAPAGDGTIPAVANYGTSNLFKFKSGDTIAQTNTTSSYRRFTASYIVNISKSQRPGIYTTTLLYSILASF